MPDLRTCVHARAHALLQTAAYCSQVLQEDCLKHSSMFLTEARGCLQVDNMTNKHAVYMTRDGRISLAGLSSSKVDYLADAMVDSIRNH